jgi:peroxiredoxin
VGYSRLVAISTDNLLKTNEFRDGEGAQWPFLSDPERVVQRDLSEDSSGLGHLFVRDAVGVGTWRA